MQKIKDSLQKFANTEEEIIAHFGRAARSDSSAKIEEPILALLMSRPCKPQEMAASLGIHQNEILKYITLLENENKIKKAASSNGSNDYFILINNE